MEFTAQQIADILNGQVEGDPEVKVSGLSKIEEGHDGAMSFLANPAYSQYLYTTGATIVVVNNNFHLTQPVKSTLIRVDNAYTAFARLLELFESSKMVKNGISPLAYMAATARLGQGVYAGEFVSVGENVVIGDNVQLFPHVFIGDNVKIGNGTILHSGVKIYRDCILGNNCVLNSGVVIGADGFGFAPVTGQESKKVIQAGNVVIGNNVDIGPNAVIDRATLGSTLIGNGVKIDAMVIVAHNVEIGENTIIAAQSGFAGSAKVGKNCMIAGQVGVVGHLSIGNDVKIGAQSGVGNNIGDGQTYLGTPAMEASKTRRLYVLWRNMDQVVKKINMFEKFIKKD